MIRIKYDPEFKTADGQPFMVLDPDILVQRKVREQAIAEWKGEKGKESWQAPMIDCDFAQAICWFVNNIPFGDEKDTDGKLKPSRKLSPEDTGNAYAVIKAFRNVNDGYVELDDSTYRWLIELNKTDGVLAFRITQAVVAERLGNTIKEE